MLGAEWKAWCVPGQHSSPMLYTPSFKTDFQLLKRNSLRVLLLSFNLNFTGYIGSLHGSKLNHGVGIFRRAGHGSAYR